MADYTWVDGEVATAAKLNAIQQQLVIQCTSGTRPTNIAGRVIYETDTQTMLVGTGSAWKPIFKPWTTFTPTWTNFTPGTSTVNAQWALSAGRVEVAVGVTLAAGFSVSGSPITLTVPGGYSALTPRSIGSAFLIDADGADQVGAVQAIGTELRLVTSTVASTSSTVPFTWAVGDSFFLDIAVAVA